jgi:hypothetical protein
LRDYYVEKFLKFTQRSFEGESGGIFNEFFAGFVDIISQG